MLGCKKKFILALGQGLEKFFSLENFADKETQKLNNYMLECEKHLVPNETSAVFEILVYKLITLKPELFIGVENYLSSVKAQYKTGFDILDKLIKLPTSEIIELGYDKKESNKLLNLFFNYDKPYYKTFLIFQLEKLKPGIFTQIMKIDSDENYLSGERNSDNYLFERTFPQQLLLGEESSDVEN